MYMYTAYDVREVYVLKNMFIYIYSYMYGKICVRYLQNIEYAYDLNNTALSQTEKQRTRNHIDSW